MSKVLGMNKLLVEEGELRNLLTGHYRNTALLNGETVNNQEVVMAVNTLIEEYQQATANAIQEAVTLCAKTIVEKIVGEV